MQCIGATSSDGRLTTNCVKNSLFHLAYTQAYILKSKSSGKGDNWETGICHISRTLLNTNESFIAGKMAVEVIMAYVGTKDCKLWILVSAV